MLVASRTPQEWFDEAERCYVAKHQGCPWCGHVHAVSRVHHLHRHSYHCQSCDFQAIHEAQANRYFAIPGEDADTVQRLQYQI